MMQFNRKSHVLGWFGLIQSQLNDEHRAWNDMVSKMKVIATKQTNTGLAEQAMISLQRRADQRFFRDCYFLKWGMAKCVGKLNRLNRPLL